MSSSPFAVSLDVPDMSMLGYAGGMGSPSETQALNDMTAKAINQMEFSIRLGLAHRPFICRRIFPPRA